MNEVEVILRWMPFVWLAIAITLAVVEAFTAQMVAIWFAIGAMVAILPAYLRLSVNAQTIVFLLVSTLTLALTRPLLKRFLKVKTVHTNADSIIGQVGVVIIEIDNLKAQGRVHVSGLDWTARSEDGEIIEETTQVLIKNIEGVKVIVERII